MLDLRTLALITTVSAVVFFLATAAIWRLVPQERSLRDWATGAMLVAAGTLLLGLRAIIPDFLSIVVANSALVLGLGYAYVGTRNLLGKGSGPPWHWLNGGAMFLACIVFTYLAPNLPMRIVALSVLISPFFAACGWLFWRHGEQQIKTMDRLTALVFIAGALVFLTRAVAAPGASVSAGYTSTPNWFLASPYFYSMLFDVWMAIMLTLKVSARLQRRLAEALGSAEAANRELRVAVNFNETILLDSPLPMGVYAASGKCILANDAYARFAGATREALLAQNFRNNPAWQRSGLLDDCLSALAQHKPQGHEAHFVNSFGKEIWFEYRILPNQINGEQHLLIQYFDLTERKLAEVSLQRGKEQLTAILNSTTESIFHVDGNGIILAINEVAAHRVHKRPDEMIGRCAYDFFPPEVAGGRRAHLAEVFRTGKAMYREDARNDHFFSLNYYPISGNDGKVASVVVYGKDITERRQNQQRLERLLAEQTAMLENEVVGIVRVRDLVIVWANPAFESMLGYAKGTMAGIPTRQNYPDEKAYLAFGAAADPVLQGGHVFRSQVEYVRKDGKHIWLDVSGAVLDKATGESLWAFVDITERKHLEQTIAQSEQRMELALAGADLGLWDLDVLSGRVMHNARLVTMLGYEPQEVEVNDKLSLSLLHPDDAARAGSAFYAHLEGETPSFEADYRVRHKDGHWVWILSRGKVVERDKNGRAVRMTGTNLDISERKGSEAKIRDLAFYDPLTQLPNRRLLLDRLGLALPASSRRNTYGAILFLDLDNFKILNDTLGHEMGDLLLIEVARQMVSCVRVEDTVARLGGDEFVVLLEELGQEAQVAKVHAKLVAEKIRKLLNAPYSLQGKIHRSSPSIGVCLFKGTGVSVSDLLMQADKAMYQSKAAGRNSLHFYDPNMAISEAQPKGAGRPLA